jgi:hypothetical protein
MMLRFAKSISIAAIILLLSTTAYSEDLPSIEQLTLKIRDVIENRNYTCDIAILRPESKKGPSELYYELIHSAQGFLHVQPLTRGIDGKRIKMPVYFIKNDRGRFLIDSDRKVAVENPRAWGGVREILDEGPFRNLRELPKPDMNVKMLGNREALLLTSDNGELFYEFFVDRKSSFPMKYKLFTNEEALFTFEVSELKFIEPTEIDDSIFEIPVGFIKPPREHRFMGGPGRGKPPWLPLVPSKELTPKDFSFDTLRPHFMKDELVYQAVFVHNDTSEIVSVFQTAKPDLVKAIEHHVEGADLNIVTLEKENILLIALGAFDDDVLYNLLESFGRDDKRAKELIEEGTEVPDWGD